MQLVGDVLAVGMESPYAGSPSAAVLFLDVSVSEAPRFLSALDLGLPTDDFGAGTIGVAPIKAFGGGCCDYLMVVTGKSNRELRFYRSLPTGGGLTTDLKARDLSWEEIARYSEDEIESDACLGDVDWPSGAGYGHQTLNFVRQGGLDGPLYLVGLRNDLPGGYGDDRVDLYQIGLDTRCPFSRVRSTHLTSYPYNGFGDSANFAAASGVYVSPSGELILYASEYENTGPLARSPDGSTTDRNTVTFVEYRHRNMVRPDSPTLHATAAVGGPFTVDEGSSVPLTGAGAPPITKAWIQLFEDDGAGASLPGFLDSDDWVAVDYPDRNADYFDDFAENAGSWRWFAPVGCTISANDYPISSDGFPGPDTVQLVGTGEVLEETDLDSLRVFRPPDTDLRISPVPAGQTATAVDYDDDVAGVTFYHVDALGRRVHACEGYYNATIRLTWDLNSDGTYETDGTSVPFSAASLDGPATVLVGARAQHPTDPTPLGVGEATATVRVLNVPPSITQFAVLDSLGLRIGVDVPFAIQGSPLTADGSFTDPGKPDHQAAMLDWGDGTVEPSSSFNIFTDAFGGAVGRLSRRHSYVLPGERTVALAVSDDDGGVATGLVAVRVLSPAQAVAEIIALLDQALAHATSDAQRTALLNARKALAGSVEGLGSNGALDKLNADIIDAALVKLRQGIDYLKAAQTAGADVGPLIALLQQIVAAIEAV
jgi:hypothetical protein